MDFKLQLVMIPVTDVDKAKDFYLERAGFRLDLDQATLWTSHSLSMVPAVRRCDPKAQPWAAARRLSAVPHRKTDEFSLRHSFYLQDAFERGC